MTIGLVVPLLVVIPASSSPSSPLALPRAAYPSGVHLVVVPATNAQADHYLGPAHRLSFEQLGRLDADGWLQFATGHFVTGVGPTRTSHRIIFGYGVNIFAGKQQAARALADVRIHTHSSRVGHLLARRARSVDTQHTLVFLFFIYRAVEVEAYYEFDGVAPVNVQHTLAQSFRHQSDMLVRAVRRLVNAPSPTATAQPSATASATATPTATVPATIVRPTATRTPLPLSPTPRPPSTSLPTPSPTRTPSPTPTETPIVLTVSAAMEQSVYPPNVAATVDVTVQANGQPLSGVMVYAAFAFPNGTKSCSARTDAAGKASCSQTVPDVPDGSQVEVTVQAVGPDGTTARTTTSFIIHR